MRPAIRTFVIDAFNTRIAVFSQIFDHVLAGVIFTDNVRLPIPSYNKRDSGL
jgi:hypothetical protein